MEQENVSLPPQAPEAPVQSEENTPVPTKPENPPESAAEEHTKILIAYFTWAENTVELGVIGVWIAMGMDWLARSVCFLWRYRREVWRTSSIIA